MVMYGPTPFECRVCRTKKVTSIHVFGRDIVLEEFSQAGRSAAFHVSKTGRVVLEFQCANGHRFTYGFELKGGATHVFEEDLSTPVRLKAK